MLRVVTVTYRRGWGQGLFALELGNHAEGGPAGSAIRISEIIISQSLTRCQMSASPGTQIDFFFRRSVAGVATGATPVFRRHPILMGFHGSKGKGHIKFAGLA